MDADAVKAVIADAETKLVGKGRLLIRKSGTEPLVRVMAECEDADLLAQVVDGIVAEVAHRRSNACPARSAAGSVHWLINRPIMISARAAKNRSGSTSDSTNAPKIIDQTGTW